MVAKRGQGRRKTRYSDREWMPWTARERLELNINSSPLSVLKCQWSTHTIHISTAYFTTRSFKFLP
jgi:hypothetical protein